jgi:MATE family multidrug resistance protein
VIAALAIPALGTLAMDPLVSIVDTAWVARLGTEALAALAIASAVFAAVFSIFNFVHMTITPLVAGEVGAGRTDRAGAVSKGALGVSFVIGVVVAFVAIASSNAIVGLFGAAPDVAELASDYLRIRFVALPMMLVAMVGHGIFRGHSDTTTPLWVAMGMNVVNLVLDPLLIFTLGLGVAGAAWATVAAQTIAAVWFLVLILGTQRERLGTGARVANLGSLGIGRILDAGWPMMIRSAALLAALTATTVAASRIGTDQVAAHQIAIQVWLFLSFVLDSFAVAAQAMVGTDLGSGSVTAARGIANRLLFLGFAAGVALSVGLALTAGVIPVLFSVDDAVRSELDSIYPFVVLLQPLTALVYVWDGIAIGASAFRYLAASMVVAGVATIVALVAVGDTLVGVWLAITLLSVTRLAAFGVWHPGWPRGGAPGPSRASPAA